jgi:GTPase SAR1 family protein
VDTFGEEEYDVLRKAIYKKTDIFFICCSPSFGSTIDNVEKWMKELETCAPDSVIYLISNSFKKTSDFSFATEGKDLQKKIKAKDFFQCKNISFLI